MNVEAVNKRVKLEFVEPLLNPENERLTAYPIADREAWEMYERARAMFWLPSEIKMSDDVQQWCALSGGMKEFLKHILQFFASSDALVTKNIDISFGTEVTMFEYQAFYRFQGAVEDIHNETYSILLETLVTEEREREKMRNAVQTHPFIRAKTEWIQEYMDPQTKPFCDRVVAFACMEGICFSASFAAIYWFKKQNLLPGMCAANEFIARDEGLHTDFACLVHARLVNPSQNVLAIVTAATELECAFVRGALGDDTLPGMTIALMCQHVESVADGLLVKLGHPRHYKVESPFPWMALKDQRSKHNFFEKVVTDYQKVGLEDVSDDCFSF